MVVYSCVMVLSVLNVDQGGCVEGGGGVMVRVRGLVVVVLVLGLFGVRGWWVPMVVGWFAGGRGWGCSVGVGVV